MAINKEMYLRSQGWVLVTNKRQGCMIIRRWSKPGTEWQGVNQGLAYRVARDSEKWRKNNQNSGC